MNRFRITLPTAAVLLAAFMVLAAPAELLGAAQQTVDFASETLGRGYWHMFIAYALAWIFVLGWAISIGRRLAEIERRLEE
jgi:CcmD family protein